ncbi:MAG: glycosyl hydrolase [Acidobacteria bacterium]|nr:MAG: glycosyl hydrolase [Acidobacteriota bacterium]
MFAAVLVIGLGLVSPATPARVCAQATTAANGAIDTSLFAGLRWRSIGPNRGGRSQAVAGSASRPLEYYFGATGGGVWKTTDGGQTWRPVSDATFRSSSVGAVAVAASNPDVVYVGMGETELRGNIIQGDGVYKSSDGGKTWSHVGLEKTMAISRIRVHPTNPDILYVAALGNPYGTNPERGVFRSKDGAKTWQRVLFRDDKTGAVDLSMDPQNPDVLYAGLWEVFRTPHSLSSGGPGSGLFKTTDGGANWTELTKNAGLPKPIWGKVGVSVSGAERNRIYAIIEAKDGGVFLSDDAGRNWKPINDDRRLRQRAFYYSRIYADPQVKDTVYILNTGIYRSTDAGKTIRGIRVPHGDNHDLWIAPNDPKRMINSNDGGANVSVNAGETWTDQDFPTAQLYGVVTTAHVPYHVCGAQQDNSTVCVPSTGTGDELYQVGGGESGYIAPDPRDVDVFYAGSYGGLLTRINRRTGERRAINIWPDNPMGHASGDMTERFQWTYPIVIAPTNPQTLYATSQHVWKSTNEGQTWEKISPDLTRHDPSTLQDSGGPITLDQTGVETYATVFALAPSPIDGNIVWAGSDDGLVHVTRDGGKNWEKVTPADLPEFARISLIEASPHDAGTAYVAANRYQRADRAPYVYRTHDYGKTWTKIVNGIRSDDFARSIEEDPKRKGLLWVGSETGMYVSFDDGDVWQSFSLDLPVTPVHGVLVRNDDLVIATHGRSFYVMDNIAVLRQIGRDTTNEPVVLFKPGDAIRSVSRGVAVDYFLKQAADKVTIELLDTQGNVIRSFTGEGHEPETQPSAQPAAGEEEDNFRPPPPRVAAKQGLNRFVWDTRYPDARTFPGLIMWAGSTRGPAAPPGQYQVRLTAAGQTKTQPFAIVRNPLGTATDADLQEQFRLAKQINDRVTAANEAVLRLRSIKEQIGERLTKLKDAKIKSTGDALTEKLTDVEGEIYQFRNRSNQDPLNFPIRLNNKLAALQGIVESGDYKPTDQSYAVFKELAAALEKQLGRVDVLIETDVDAFNKQIVRKKLEPLKTEVPAPR